MEREYTDKRSTIEVLAIRAETDRTSIALYDDIEYLPLSSEVLFLGQGHVANVLSSDAFYLNDFVLVRGKKSPDDTIEKVNAELIRKLNLRENELYIIEDNPKKRSPALIGQIAWKDLLDRESFTGDRVIQFYLLDSLEQEIGQADLDIELTWLTYRDNYEKYLTRIKRILLNALSVEAFLESAKIAGLPLNEIGPEEYKKTFMEILDDGAPANLETTLDQLELLARALKKYKKPITGINKHLRRLLGLKKGKRRAASQFLKKYKKPIEIWNEADFIEYQKFIGP